MIISEYHLEKFTSFLNLIANSCTSSATSIYFFGYLDPFAYGSFAYLAGFYLPPPPAAGLAAAGATAEKSIISQLVSSLPPTSLILRIPSLLMQVLPELSIGWNEAHSASINF
jgi:hypothetical protein